MPAEAHNFIVQAPDWALTVGVLGRTLVIVSIGLFLASALLALFKKHERAVRLSARIFIVAVVGIALVFGCHVTLLMNRQYEYQYVFNNTKNDLSNVYRFSAAWASQEGSFLLWTLTSAVVALIVSRFTAHYRPVYTLICSLVLSAMLGIVAYESPFALIEVAKEDLALLPKGVTIPLVADGRGLNPTLENYWMAIHPWVIFIGFGSLLSLFAWSWSAAVSKDWSDWVPRVRPLGIFCVTMLGVGLVMGGLWAYETLGWGGFWAWDPVENVSLVPFLACVAFAHALYVVLRRGVWQKLLVVLGALPFLWFVYGTFLTRSGALADVSVHSFARMNEGAHRLLLDMVIGTAVACLALVIYVSVKKFSTPPPRPSGNRLFGIGLGIATLYGIAMMAAIGMSVPFFSGLMNRFDAEGKARVIEEATYNQIVAYPFIPAMLLMAIVPFLGWTRTKGQRWSDLASIGISALLISSGVGWYLRSQGLFMNKPAALVVLSLLLLLVCISSIISNLWRLLERSSHHSGRWAPFLMHTGVSLLLLGLIVSRIFEQTADSAVSASRPTRLAAGPANFLLSLSKTPTEAEWTDRSNVLKMDMVDMRNQSRELHARVSHYFKIDPFGDPPMMVTRPAIFTSPLYDLYLSVNAPVFEYSEPMKVSLGETKTAQAVSITYLESTRSGTPGTRGAKFGAKLKVVYDAKTFFVEPSIEIGRGDLIKHAAPAGDDFLIELEGVDATSSDATISVQFSQPFFPVQLFYKPLTFLVWIGAGIMALGGFLTIYQVRPRSAITD